jgi:hypothetical protein
MQLLLLLRSVAPACYLVVKAQHSASNMVLSIVYPAGLDERCSYSLAFVYSKAARLGFPKSVITLPSLKGRLLVRQARERRRTQRRRK